MESLGKRVLIFSDGPVPTPEHTKVEGGGLRSWGLAQGIRQNNKEIQITVAYNDIYKKDTFTDSYEGVSVKTWTEQGLKSLVEQYDTIIVSYCMGNLSVSVVDVIGKDKQLILDCYVPIYVEMSARKSENLADEYNAFNFELGRWDYVLKRGDVFLCANQAQKDFYEGVLSSVGRLNPITYGQDLIRIVPYGIYRDEPQAQTEPLHELISNKKALKVLWFGGIYPWFNLNGLIDAVASVNEITPTELVIVGAKNPFNNHPDFNKKYDELVDYIETNKYTSLIHVVDWVDFNSRADWYLDSDVVVVVNEEGPENKLAWRTRLVDFIWADLPILTNAGDPLGEMLIANEAAKRLKGLTKDDIQEGLLSLVKDDERHTLKKNVVKFRKTLYWDTVTAALTDDILNDTLPKDNDYRVGAEFVSGVSRGKLTRLAIKIRKVPAYYRKHGAKATFITAKTKIAHKVKHKLGVVEKRSPKLIMVSHQLDLSGAPYVFLDIVEQAKKDPKLAEKIDFRTYTPVAKENIKKLGELGVKPKVYLDRNETFSYVKGDIVVLNSFAVSVPLVHSLFSALESGVVKHVFWYAHEATPEGFIGGREAQLITKNLKAGKLTLYGTAKDCTEKYIEFFGTNANIKQMPYRFDLPSEEFNTLKVKDFDSLQFILPGTVGDGRKGQLPVLYAFIDFYNNYYKNAPSKYRDFKLLLVGLDNSYLAKQIVLNGEKSLGDKFIYDEKVSREKNLEYIKASNVTLCYSLQEALPLFVYEGMAYGHPIIRNESSGQYEQLKDGVNGYAVHSDDYEGLVSTIERVLNKKATSATKLVSMSKESNKIAKEATKKNYTILEDIKKVL